ncbi:MAG: DNA polymerase III subunit delta' [Hyphomicrobiales bacterium]|nr:DNA polymerase III subunit delta' [Hyphomicrobiales bacterium]
MSARKRDEAAPESDALPGAPAPRITKTLFGHAAAEHAFLDAFRSGRMPHAWLIGGRPGIGKATLAWRVARFLVAHPEPSAPAVQRAQDLSVDPESKAAHLVDALAAPDIALLRREWNYESRPPKHFTEIRVDDTRRALKMFHHNAAAGGWRICIVDAADDLNRSSANALLKMIEEPPARALFLIVAHEPGRLLPTIRSRCRKLMLKPLHIPDIVRAVEALDDSWEKYSAAEIEKAARKAGGSVRETLRVLARQGAASAKQVEDLLRNLPKVDWSLVQTLVDTLARPQSANEFDAFLETVFGWLDTRVKEAAGQGPRRLAPLAEAWDRIGAAAREAEIYNLDKRGLIIQIAEELETATKR